MSTAALPFATLEGDGAPEVDDEFEPPFGTCAAELGIERELEPVIYQGVDVGVGVDLQNSLVYAYTVDDCARRRRRRAADRHPSRRRLAPNTQP